MSSGPCPRQMCIRDRDMGGTDIGAAAALHAVLQMKLRKPFPLPHPHGPVDRHRVQVHGAAGDTVAAADAHRLRLTGGIVLLVGETQQGVGVLHHLALIHIYDGARPLRRAIAAQVEDPAADLLLEGALCSGGTLRVVAEGDRIQVRPA